MNGRDAVKAMLDGKTVRRTTWGEGSTDLKEAIGRADCERWSLRDIAADDGEWEVVAGDPATGEELTLRERVGRLEARLRALEERR